MAKPIVAIVGRPNVGKSQLFNRLAGKRLSIVEDTPGVTRDRLYADSDWRGRDFTVIDTGGIEPSNDNEILQFMRFQAETAISHADVIILITDLRTGITAADQDVASMLLRSGKPLVLAVNKCDKPGDPPAEFYEFYNLGLGEPYGISALHGYGVGELLDAAYEYFPPADEEEEDADRIRVASASPVCSTACSVRSELLSPTSPVRHATVLMPMWTTRTASLRSSTPPVSVRRARWTRRSRNSRSCVRY